MMDKLDEVFCNNMLTKKEAGQRPDYRGMLEIWTSEK